jgi:RHS repeat-associated protein
MKRLLLSLLLSSMALSATLAPAFAQSEIILDNVSPVFTTTGTWPTSTAVSGYIGANYQTKQNSAPPGAVVVDNGDAGFSVTGTWPTSTSVSGYLGTNYQVHAANGDPPSAIVVDNSAGSAVGTWPASTSVSGYLGTNYQVHTAGTGTNTFTWTATIPASGSYEVYARWTSHPNRATNAKYVVNHAGGADTVTVNQEQNTATWVLLGTYSFNAGSASVVLSDNANEYVVADAVKFQPPGAAPSTATWAINVPSAGSYNVYARWTAHPNRATDAKYVVTHAGGSNTVTVNQEAASGTWNLLGTYSFNAGNTTVTLNDQANGYVIADAVMLLPPGSAPNTATWTPNVAQAGTYEVYARWTANPNRATDAKYTVTHASGNTTTTVNQQANGAAWNLLGTYTLTPGTTHKVTLTDESNGYVVADAIRLVPITLQPLVKLYYIHTDHLNTPRLVADDLQTTVWKWEQEEPFGANACNPDPDADNVAFEFNLRFPGQYFDKETNVHYNYFRDYDPSIGRFIESDPAALEGLRDNLARVGGLEFDLPTLGSMPYMPRRINEGLNLFAYAELNPIVMADPLGLWSITVSAFKGTGGALVFGQNPNGTGFVSVRGGIGYGGGIKWDPTGKQFGYDPNDCSWGISGGGYYSGGVAVGPGFVNFSGGAGVNASASGLRGFLEPIKPGAGAKSLGLYLSGDAGGQFTVSGGGKCECGKK